MRTLLLLALTIIVVCSCKSRQQLASVKATDATSEFSINDVVTILSTKQPTTVDQFLAELPSDFRKNHTAMYDSKSRQPSTPSAPRMILFNKNFVLTFTGIQPKLKGEDLLASNSIEMMQFDAQRHRYDFFEVIFDEKTPRSAKDVTKNAKVCTTCHSEPMRPNWEPYFVWPGAYGSEDDGLSVGSEELQNWQSFLTRAQSLPRYRHLADSLAENRKSLDSLLNAKVTIESRLGNKPLVPNGASRPNNTLLRLLSETNIPRIARQLFQDRAYQKNKYLVAAILGGCLLEYGDELPQQVDPAFVARDKRLANIKPANDPLFASTKAYLSRANQLEYFNTKLKLGMQVDADNWSLNFTGDGIETGSSRDDQAVTAPFNNGNGDYSSMVLFAGLSALDPDFKDFEVFVCDGDQYQFNGTTYSTRGTCYDWNDVMRAKAAGKFAVDVSPQESFCKVAAARMN